MLTANRYITIKLTTGRETGGWWIFSQKNWDGGLKVVKMGKGG